MFTEHKTVYTDCMDKQFNNGTEFDFLGATWVVLDSWSFNGSELTYEARRKGSASTDRFSHKQVKAGVKRLAKVAA